MLGNLLIGALVVLLVLVALWAMRRARNIRVESKSREAQALALIKAGGVLPGSGSKHDGQGETVFAGLPSQMAPGDRGIEVNDVSEVVDIDELLRDEQAAAAERARALLEEPTNIDLSPDTFPPLAVPRVPPAVAATPGQAPPRASIATAAGAAAAMAAVRAQPPAAPKARATPVAARAATPAQPAGRSAQAPAHMQKSAQAMAPAHHAAPAPRGGGGATAVATAPPVVRPPAAQPVSRPSPAAMLAGRTGSNSEGDVPLRELALAWFEARGYRGAPASPAVRPIELVLRHREDPGRAYALVVEPSRVTGDRVVSLAAQARAIGLVRLLVVAETGAEPGASTRKKGVRLMDRATMNAELKKLDLSIAAKIIAVARKRATTRAAAS